MSDNDDFSELNDRFIHAVRESYAKYKEHGPRSTKKLRPLHQWVADEMQSALGQGYTIQSLRKEGQGREEKIVGKYYDKNVDISISKEDGMPLAVISVKFITSNFKQNANNYFEHLMGETANIRRSDVFVGHFMVLPNVIPYFTRNGNIAHEETIGDKHLQKYINLGLDEDYPHRPDAMGIGVISLPLDELENVSKIELVNLTEMEVSEDIKDALSGEFSIFSFIEKMTDLVEQKE